MLIGIVAGVAVAGALIGAFVLGQHSGKSSSGRRASTATTVDATTRQAVDQFVAAAQLLTSQFTQAKYQTYSTPEERFKAEGAPFRTFALTLGTIPWPASVQLHANDLIDHSDEVWAGMIQSDVQEMAPAPFIAAEAQVASDLGIHASCPFALPQNAIGWDPRCSAS
jgi:hypothetical protein